MSNAPDKTLFNELLHPRIHPATEKQRRKQFAPNRFENSHAQLSSSFKPFGSRIWNPRESASEKYSLSLLKTTLVIRWGCPSNHITRGFILNTRWKYFTLSADKNYQNYNRSHPTNNSVKRFNQQDWIKNLYPRFLNQHPQSNEVVLQPSQHIIHHSDKQGRKNCTFDAYKINCSSPLNHLAKGLNQHKSIHKWKALVVYWTTRTIPWSRPLNPQTEGFIPHETIIKTAHC